MKVIIKTCCGDIVETVEKVKVKPGEYVGDIGYRVMREEGFDPTIRCDGCGDSALNCEVQDELGNRID